MRVIAFLALQFCIVIVAAIGTNVVIENQLSGIIQSPNFPDAYPDNVNKTWTIRVEEGYRIALSFTAFEFEDSYDADLGGACVYDYVKVCCCRPAGGKSCTLL